MAYVPWAFMIVEENLLIEAVAGLPGRWPGRCCQGAAQRQGLPSQGPAARIALITAVLPARGAGRRFALACRAGIAALCRTGPVEVALCRTGSGRRGPASHRAGTGPGRDMPGDRGGNGVTAGTGRSPAASTGKYPGLLGKLTAIAGHPAVFLAGDRG